MPALRARGGEARRDRQLDDLEAERAGQRAAVVGGAGINIDAAIETQQRQQAGAQPLSLVATNHDDTDAGFHGGALRWRGLTCP